MLGRPHRVSGVFESVRAATPDARVLFIADPSDRETQDAIAMVDGEMISPGGTYAQKINAGARVTTEPFVFLGADDLCFYPGWFQFAASAMSDAIMVVGTNDLGNRRVTTGQHSTHQLVARSYIELGQIDGRPGLLHEGYHHNFCDDEFVGVAKYRGLYRHAHDAIVEHLHPLWGKGADDDIYRLGMEGWGHDGRLHRERTRLWT